MNEAIICTQDSRIQDRSQVCRDLNQQPWTTLFDHKNMIIVGIDSYPFQAFIVRNI